jgi:hypothetical protein
MSKSASSRLRRLLAYTGLCGGALILAALLLLLAFRGAILNGYGKQKAEQAFAKAHPGCVLRIGELDYVMRAHCLVAQSVTLSTTNATFNAGRVALTGVRWARLLCGTASLAEVLAQASLDVTNLSAEFPQSHYGLSCARLRGSVAPSELIAEETELKPLIEDEAFFAAHEFRTTRFHVTAPECRVSGLDYGELLQGKSCRVRSVHFARPSFDALVNRDKLVGPFVTSPLMVHEALAALPLPLQVDTLTLTNGHLTYGERIVAGAAPGVLTFGAVSMTVEGIANRGAAPAAIQLRAQGDFMNAGVLKVLMEIPVNPADLSLRYSGSLSAMDLPRLNAFLDIAAHTRIKSGHAQEVAFDIVVIAGHARGQVRAIYQDLVIAILDDQTGTEKGVGNRLASFLANAFKVRNASAPDAAGALKAGKVDYTRQPEDEFVQFAWFALRSGVLDVIGF